jgi:hypothetical protein
VRLLKLQSPLQLWLKLRWVNVVLAIVVQPVHPVKLVATVVTALMVCQASQEIVVRQPHQPQN